MSKYTTELRYICETKSGLSESVGDNDVDDIIAGARTEIFNFDYPIFDDEYKEPLESKILSHFYTREIGSETYGLWHLRLKNKMREIMPYYNKLYESELLQYNPLDDTNYYEEETGNLSTSGTSSDNTSGNVTENTEGSKTGTTSGQSDMDGTITDAGTHADTTVDRFHDTPQGAITDLSQSQYLTNVRQINNNGTDGNTKTYDTQNTTSGTNSESTEVDRTTDSSVVTERENSQTTQNVVTKHMHGKRGMVSYNKLLKEYRANLLNIDMRVIGELEELFIQLW